MSRSVTESRGRTVSQSSPLDRDIVLVFRDDVERLGRQALKLWHDSGHPNWQDIAERCGRFSSNLSGLLEGKKLDPASQSELHEELDFFSTEMQRMIALQTNAPRTESGELLRDLHAYHRRLVASVRALERGAK